MQTVYDTRKVHPLDRYDYYRAQAAAAELAPVAAHGRSPRELLAVMRIARIGDFALETVTWAADTEVVARRTDRLIRVSDPDCYRVFLGVTGGARMEQAGHRVTFRPRDMAFYDVSLPWRATHTTTPHPMRVVMVTFPRTLLPISRGTVAPLVGAVMPRNLPGRGLVAQFLVDLTDGAVDADNCDLSDVLRECVVGLVRQRLGLPAGITPHTRRLLHMASVQTIIRRHLGDPALDPERIARAANMSPRYLHAIFKDAELTPMQLLKRMRLAECHRSLQDPALAATPIKDIIAAHGYLRSDQFARDFKQVYGVSAKQVRTPTRAVG